MLCIHVQKLERLLKDVWLLWILSVSRAWAWCRCKMFLALKGFAKGFARETMCSFLLKVKSKIKEWNFPTEETGLCISGEVTIPYHIPGCSFSLFFLFALDSAAFFCCTGRERGPSVGHRPVRHHPPGRQAAAPVPGPEDVREEDRPPGTCVGAYPLAFFDIKSEVPKVSL